MTSSSEDHKRGIFWFLLTSVLIAMAFRWPTTYHETGVDSFFIHSLANSAAQFGEIRWVVNPLSLFGLYPLSYASGVPIMLGEFSNMTGVTVEETILIFSFLMAIIGSLTAFMLGLEIRNSAPFAFAISALFSVCPIMLNSTQWTIGTRGVFMAMFPLTLWFLVRLGKIEYQKYNVADKRELWTIFFIIMVLIAFIHNLFFMMIIFIIAYFFTVWVRRLLGSQNEYYISSRKKRWYLSTSMTLMPMFIAVIFIIIIANYTGWLGFQSFEIGFFEGNSIITQFLNYIAPIAATIGFPICLLAPIGVLLILKNKKNNFIGVFFITSLLLILPFSGSRIYEKYLYPIILCVLILYPTYMIISSKNRRRYAKIAIVAFILTLPVNVVILDVYNRWPETKEFNDGISTPDHVYMTALYYGNDFPGEAFTTNNAFLLGKIQSYTNCPAITTEPTNLLIYRIIDSDDIDARLNSIEEILSSKGNLYSTYWQIIVNDDYSALYFFRNNPAAAYDILSRYDIHALIEDKRLDGKILGYGGNTLYPKIGTTPFIDGVHNATYKIYENEIDIIWEIR